MRNKSDTGYFINHSIFPDILHASAKSVATVAYATRYAWVVSTLLTWIAILLLTALRRPKCVVHRHHERAGRDRRNRPRHGLLTRLHWNTWSAVIIINALYNFNFQVLTVSESDISCSSTSGGATTPLNNRFCSTKFGGQAEPTPICGMISWLVMHEMIKNFLFCAIDCTPPFLIDVFTNAEDDDTTAGNDNNDAANPVSRGELSITQSMHKGVWFSHNFDLPFLGVCLTWEQLPC